MTTNPYANMIPSRISRTAFETTTWSFYTLAIIMAIARTTFRIHSRRKVDTDDCLLILAVLCLTGATTILNILYPALYIQNSVTIGVLIPGTDFATQMLAAMKLESAASNLTFVTIFAVKYGYLMFFRNLLQRTRKMMWWWWTVFFVVTASAITGFVFLWMICPHYQPDFLQICPVPVIAARENVWLITTTVSDIVSDAFIITIPVMILWNVKIPLRAKIGIGCALGLSLFMIIIAAIRLGMRDLIPDVSDTIWIYFCWNIECSVAVFMISATAFRSTFGTHQNAKSKSSSSGKHIPVVSMSSRLNTSVGNKPTHSIRPYRPASYDSEDKLAYRVEIQAIPQQHRDMF